MEVAPTYGSNLPLDPQEHDLVFEMMLDELRREHTETLDRQFSRIGLKPPILRWNPAGDSLPDPTLRAAHACWERLRAGRAFPDWSDFRAEGFGHDIVNFAVVDPIPGTLDFHFAIYGSAIAGAARRDYRGMTIREMAIKTGSPAPLFYRAVYALAQARGVPAYTWNAAMLWQPLEGWNRVVLPFHVRAEGRLRFLVAIKSEGSRVVSPESARRSGQPPEIESPGFF